jgi:hypothetical protein
MKNAIFILSGNARTFIDCINTIFMHVISKLFPEDVNIYIYMYLKLTDPGPKGQHGWNFKYKDNDYNDIVEKINEMKINYRDFNIEYKILNGDEISNHVLMPQVKNRKLYINHYAINNMLFRGIHCHYNLEMCGKYILDKEKHINSKFDFMIYIRPDLFFTNDCDNIKKYSTSIVTLGEGPNYYNNDHIAIIPRDHLNNFFFDRMNIYRNNTNKFFSTAEEVYWHTITYEVKPIGKYYIKRS